MSIVCNMVGKAGGGEGITATDAILRVQAPAGSVVIITKGATTKSDQGHENAADNTVYDYYFIIHASQFDAVNPWTVTATLGTSTATGTVIINAPDEYDVILSYWNGEIYLNGTQYTETGGISQVRVHQSGNLGTVNIGAAPNGVIQFTEAANQNCGVITGNALDLTNFSKVRVKFESNTYSTTNRLFIFVTDDPSNIEVNSSSSLVAIVTLPSNYTGVYELSISGVSGNHYVGVGGWGAVAYGCTISEWYLT